MKKYIILLLVFVAISCTPDDSVAPVTYHWVGIRTTGLPASITENSGTTINVPVYFGGELENPSSFTVGYTVTGGTYGSDYTIVGGTGPTGTLTIPAGETGLDAKDTIKIVPIGDALFEPDVALTVTISDASNGLSVGYPLKAVYKFKIANDDCDYVPSFWEGTFSALEKYAGGNYGPYDIDLVQDGVDPDKFSFDNFYDSGCNAYMIFDGANVTVSFPDQAPCGVALTNSSGTFNQCTGVITINLNFDGGDWVYQFTKK